MVQYASYHFTCNVAFEYTFCISCAQENSSDDAGLDVQRLSYVTVCKLVNFTLLRVIFSLMFIYVVQRVRVQVVTLLMTGS